MRSIFYATSNKKAHQFFRDFEKKRQQDLPSAVKCLGNSLEFCLTYLEFPENEWISIRTNNVIKRLIKEYKHRTRPMEIVAGENAFYRLLASISLKMELHWRSTPVGKASRNLPFFNSFNYLTIAISDINLCTLSISISYYAIIRRNPRIKIINMIIQ